MDILQDKSLQDKSLQDKSLDNILPFSYFIGNKEIISKLKLELIQLRGRRYSCQDIELPYIDKEIEKIEKTIKYNVSLSSSLV